MLEKLEFDELLNNYKADPFEYIDILAIHTGVVTFEVNDGDVVQAPSGEWKQAPGTGLYTINRERNPKLISSKKSGTIAEMRKELDGHFVESGEKLMTIKHPLKKKDIIENILKEVLSLFVAPESAQYFFSLNIQSRMHKDGERGVVVEHGEEILTMSLMKRDTPVHYDGEPGVIHSVYFKPGISVDQGEPLLGICAQDKLHLIEKIVTRVKADWDSN